MCAQDVKKVINSAAANATNNLRLSLESLMIDEIIVSNGIVYKRVMPSARGNAHPFMKRCTNIKVVVSGLKKEVKLKKEVTESKKVDVDAKVEKATKKKEAK
jgi:large subunit ribosomal protein L22